MFLIGEWEGDLVLWCRGLGTMSAFGLGYILWAYPEIVAIIFRFASTTYTVFGLDYVAIV